MGDVCSIKSGYTPSSEELSSEGVFPYFKVAEMNLPGNEKYLINTPSYLSGDIKTFPKNSIVFPKNGAAVATNKKRILQQDSVVDLNTAVMIANQNISVKYLFYILLNIDFASLIKRGAVPTLNLSSLKEFAIPVPPIEVQEQIVAELDKINEVIEDSRELLRALDALAQSLFYDFFGDPVTNPKGWNIIKLDKLIQPKKSILRATRNFTQNDYITYIDISSINRNSNSISTPSVIAFGDAPSRAQQCVKQDDLLVSLVRPNLKNIALCHLKSNSLVASSGFCVLRSNNMSNSAYLLYLFLAESTTEYLCSKISGAAYPAITENDIREMLVPFPPFDLQEKFAARIEQIEAQKKTVEETIANLQVLLDSRMDYWFN